MDNATAPTIEEAVQQLQASRIQDPSDNLVETEETEANAEVEAEVNEEIHETEAGVEGDEGEEVDLESPSLRTIKDNGELHEVTDEEYDKYASAGHNYTHKVMAHAEEVKAFKTKSEAELAKLAELANTLSSHISEQEQSIDWEELRDTDPSEYLKQKELIQNKKDALKVAQQEQQEKQAAQRAEIADSEAKKLKEIMAWADEKSTAQDMESAGSYMESIGISAQDQSNILDHRLFKMAIDASKYKALMSKKGKVVEQIKKAPKSAKQGQKAKPDQTELEAARQKIARSGGKSNADLVELMRLRRGK